ncbi:g4079 [Coccomyxa viridis]|uniref:G4079 protein n=1 Tax=Coccomyxa viridis TaxID=1274662 RepID=A0ABP1FWA3_9CHLO
MLKALGSQLQRQQGCPTSLLPYFQVAGFAKKKGKDDDSGPDPKSNRLLKILEPKPIEKMPKLSEEDETIWKEATKHYNKAKLYEHRMWQTDISIKIQLKEAALAALPEALRREAVKTQTDLPPPNRRMFTQTPPIPGFSEQQADRGRRRRGQT